MRVVPDHGSLLAADVTGALEGLGLPVLKARSHQRVSYPNSLATGITVFETSDRTAQAEITAIYQEFIA
jgi:chromosome partitioning protein